MLADQTAAEGSPLETLAAVADAAELVAAVHACRTVHVADVAARLRGRAVRRDPERSAAGARARARARASRSCASRGRTRSSAAATTCCPTTSRRSRPTRSPTGCCRLRARRPTSPPCSPSCSRGCPSRCEQGRAARRSPRAGGLHWDAASPRSSSGGCSARAEVALLGGGARRGGAAGAHLGRAARAVRTSSCAVCPQFAHAGETVRVALELRPLEGARSGRAAFREAGGGPVCALRPVSVGGLRVLRGSYELGPLRARRARARRAESLVREDPFGLARRADDTRGSTALTVVGPPLELPDVLAAGRGEVALARQRLRSGGHELHGVREHQPGESLRGVHWPATAHHGRLMVKELDDPAGDELAVVLDARASADVGELAGLELRAGGRGGRGARWRGRRPTAVARVSSSPGPTASRRARRAHGRAPAAGAASRPAGERSPGELLARLAAERIEVVTSRPAALVGALRAAAARRRRDRPIELRCDGATRCRGHRRPARRGLPRAGAAATRARAGCSEPARSAPRPRAARRRLRARLRVRSPARARPAGAGALDAAAGRHRRPGHRSRSGGAARGQAARPAGARARGARRGLPRPPAGGRRPARRSAASRASCADAPGAWVQVVLPFGARRAPGVARGRARSALFAWLAALAWFWLARPRPLVAALLALLPFALSATVYELPQYPWRALVAGALLFAFLLHAAAPPAAAWRSPRRSPRSRSRPARGGPPCRPPRGRRSCRGRRGRSRAPRAPRPASISSGT